MKKAYEPPKVELLEFDHTDIVCTSGSGKTDLGGEQAAAWTCETRYVDEPNMERTVCGPVPGAS